MRGILVILSWLYGVVMATRNRLYDTGVLRTHRVALPVVSVGNLTVGGSGKTPLVLHIAGLLLEVGSKPVILSRGYGGRIVGPHLVGRSDRAVDVGDEPLLMARRALCPVVIARDRVAGARWILAQGLGTCIILDDGFQHRRLARDLDVLTVDVSTADSCEAFLRGELLPSGRFRESRLVGLPRADLVVFNHRQVAPSIDDQLRTRLERLCEGIPHLSATVRPIAPRVGDAHAALPVGAVVAFCAIANPAAFYRTLQGLGYTIAAQHSFADHHVFSRGDLESIGKLGYPLVCTEKDFVKLPAPWCDQVAVLRISTVLADDQALRRPLERLIGAAIQVAAG